MLPLTYISAFMRTDAIDDDRHLVPNRGAGCLPCLFTHQTTNNKIINMTITNRRHFSRIIMTMLLMLLTTATA